RKEVKRLLYLAALSATRNHPHFIAFRDRLEANKKTPKQAICAAARKLIVIANAMIRDQKDFDEATV
ncbi:MAG: IS110 family transposase, partial [Pikeienuella sp.]